MKFKLVIYLMLSCLFTGCGTITTRAPLDATHDLVVETQGVRARAEVLCLTAHTIKSLLGSEIPPEVSKKTCYRVILLSSDSSSIARAVSAYVSAEKEFLAQITGASDTFASAIVEEAVSSATTVETLKTRVDELSKTLTETEAAQTSSQIKAVLALTNDPSIKEKLNAASKALEKY